MKGNEIFQPLESPKCRETTFVNIVTQISLAKWYWVLLDLVKEQCGNSYFQITISYPHLATYPKYMSLGNS